MRTNDANNYIVGQISRTVFGEVRNAASTNASRSFLDRIFINFSDLHDKTAEAAKGADDLKGGISKAKQGAKDLADGLKDSKAGSKKLSDGIVKLNQGSRDLATGSAQVAAWAPRSWPTRSTGSPVTYAPSSRTTGSPSATRPAWSPTPPGPYGTTSTCW